MAAIFDLYTDKIEAAGQNMSGAGTVSIHFKPDSASGWGGDGITHFLYYLGPAGYSNCLSVLKYAASGLAGGWYGPPDDRTFAEGQTILAGWNTLICTWDDTANETRVYLNGTQILSNTAAQGYYNNASDFTRIGQGNAGGDAAGNAAQPCRLFRCMLLSRVVTAPERATIELFDVPSNATGRVSKWDMATDANDSWGSNHGTATGVTFDNSADPAPPVSVRTAAIFQDGNNRRASDPRFFSPRPKMIGY